jgi:hypothetical protein
MSGHRSFAMTKARRPASFSVAALSSRVSGQGHHKPALRDLLEIGIFSLSVSPCARAQFPGRHQYPRGSLVWLPGHHYRRADCARVTPAGGERKSLLSHTLTQHCMQSQSEGRSVRRRSNHPPSGRRARRVLELPRAPESGSSRGRRQFLRLADGM